MPKYSKTKASKKQTKRSMYGGDISEKLQKFLEDNGLLSGMDFEFSNDDQVLGLLSQEQRRDYAQSLKHPVPTDAEDSISTPPAAPAVLPDTTRTRLQNIAAARRAAEETDELPSDSELVHNSDDIDDTASEIMEPSRTDPEYIRNLKIQNTITIDNLHRAGYTDATEEQAEQLQGALIKLNTSGENQNIQEVLNNIEALKAALAPIVPRDGGAKRKSKKKVGGAAEELDTSRIYNTQGLIGSTIDPLKKADNYGSGADLIPQPFSSRGVSSLSSAQLDTVFINDITPPLGMIGGRKQKKVTRK